MKGVVMATSQIHVYEPALCCNTGVCGPDVPQELVTFTADVEYVQAAGGAVQRHNLANDPQAFAQDEAVRSYLQKVGSDGLPLTVVDGVTVMTGTYPSRDQLMRFAGVDAPHARPVSLPVREAAPSGSGCCGGGGTDCC